MMLTIRREQMKAFEKAFESRFIRQAMATLAAEMPEVCELLGTDGFHTLLKKAVSIAPQVPELGFNLAHALAAAGLLDESVSQYKRVLDADPGFGSAYVDLARVLKKLGRRQEALDAIRQAAAVDPGRYGEDHLLASEFGTPTAASNAVNANPNVRRTSRFSQNSRKPTNSSPARQFKWQDPVTMFYSLK
jgi:tetratricopeptide (TPR) repeat protein